MFVNKFKGLIVVSALASMGLSACVVSDNPYTNAAATTAAISVASMLFYSLSDGYYYDQSYNRMPRDYRPDAHIPVQRVSSMDDYRRQHPQQQQYGRGRYQNDNYHYERGRGGYYR